LTYTTAHYKDNQTERLINQEGKVKWSLIERYRKRVLLYSVMGDPNQLIHIAYGLRWQFPTASAARVVQYSFF
jgi:hypothetical protein